MVTLNLPTPAPAAQPPVRRDWLDRFRAYDPGGTRVRMAAQVVVTMLASMAAERVFFGLTHALAIPAGPGVPAALVAAQHHGVLVVTLMVGAIVGLCGSFAAPMFGTARERALNLALVPIPMVSGFAIGLLLAPYKIAGFVAVVVVLTAGAYCRRFGPRGFFGGVFTFIGVFFGLFLHGVITISAIGWLAAEIGLAVVVTILVQVVVFRPRADRTLRRLRRSFGARLRAVTAVALALVDLPAPAEGEPDPRARERRRLTRLLSRRTLRFNETALMVDASLEEPGALLDGTSPGFVHQRLFDVELATTNLARFTVSLAPAELPGRLRELIRAGLAAVGEVDPDGAEATGRAILEASSGSAEAPPDRTVRILTQRFAQFLIVYASALRDLRAAADGPWDGLRVDDAGEPEFVAAAALAGGWLPGSADVSATASQESRVNRWIASGAPPNVRVAVQMGVAVSLALTLGYQVDHRRWYWAVIAAFVTFMGAHNAGEQLRKGSLRVLGTLAGVFLGALLAHLVGPHVYVALAVIMLALFTGLILMRSNYAWFVVAITISVSQLYVQLGEYSDGLLRLRLGETALGAGVALLTVLVVMPLRTGRVVRVATREYLVALDEVVGAAHERLCGTGGIADVRAAARRLDAAYQALAATLTARGFPLLPTPSARLLFVNSLSASRNYARNLLTDTAGAYAFSPTDTPALDVATSTLRSSLAQLTARLREGPAGEYTRSASLFEHLGQQLGLPETARPLLALRDLQLIDGALAQVADQLGLTVTALD